MNWIKELFFERDISLFQIFMWFFMAAFFPPFASILNFIITAVWAVFVRYINDKIMEL